MDPVLITALKTVSTVKRGLDQASLRAQIDAIERRLNAVGEHLAEDAMSRLRAGFSHLTAAQAVSSSEMKAVELAEARKIFAEFSERRGGDKLTIDFLEMTWRHIAALGHIGNFYYFLLNDEERVALQHAYGAIELHPMVALTVLPRELISDGAWSLVPPGVHDPETLRASLPRKRAAVAEERRRWGLDMAWRVPAAAGTVVLGFAVSPFNPMMAGVGVQRAIGILATSPQQPTQLVFRTKAYMSEIKKNEDLLAPITKEAATRRRQLQQLGT